MRTFCKICSTRTSRCESLINSLIHRLSYTTNGIVHMLERNRRIKTKPERFQNCKKQFDVIICLEERVYDQVVEDLMARPERDGRPVHVINIDIQDNHEEATMGAFIVYELAIAVSHCLSCTALQLEACVDMDNEIDEVLIEYESKCNRQILHTVLFY